MSDKTLVRVLLYVKEGCHLCDDMILKLDQYGRNNSPPKPYQIETRDIEDDSGWFEQYREYVPVIVIDEEEVCHYFFDQEQFEESLKCQ